MSPKKRKTKTKAKSRAKKSSARKASARKATSKRKTVSKRKTKTKAKTRARTRATTWVDVKFRTYAYDDLGITSSAKLQRHAMRWAYTLAHRSRWSGRATARENLNARAESTLLEVGMTKQELARLSEVSMVQVDIPFVAEETGWEARITPWEHLISSATKKQGRDRSMTIVRHLQRQTGPEPKRRGKPRRVLYVESAPMLLRKEYIFDFERDAVEPLAPGKVEELIDPTREELAKRCKEFQPDFIHLAGVDVHQGKSMLADEDVDVSHWGDRDGLVLKGKGKNVYDPISAEELADALNAGASKPHLVFANLYHSASRTCAMAVAKGAGAAIGFQDSVNDDVAEIFIGDFYDAYQDLTWDLLGAYEYAISTLRRSAAKLTGTGIVLWSDHSLIEREPDDLRRLQKIRDQRKEQIATAEQIDAWLADDKLRVEVETKPQLNYSLLHNNSGGLFRDFFIGKDEPGTLNEIDVRVELHTGSETVAYRATTCAMQTRTPLDRDVCIPLTSEMLRTVQEALRTTLYVEVSALGKMLKRQTFGVKLLPVDEWKDDDENRQWLPSFVFPRDPAVRKIFRSAQHHLMTLADDSTAGFDGYQSGDAEVVDRQVQAIWASIVHDFKITYINPPPTYTVSGQRLRTPSEILRAGHGTCIDLALMIAGCLEYIDIKPVIFLLEGHAFVGYWRSEDDYYDFAYGDPLLEEEETKIDNVQMSTGTSNWVVPADLYTDVMRLVNGEKIYPIEATGVTEFGSFWESVDAGYTNLRSKREFHSMVDIQLARDNDVTPLPIIEEESNAE